MRLAIGRRLIRLAPEVRPWLVYLVVLLLATTMTYVGQGLLVALSLARIFAGRCRQAPCSCRHSESWDCRECEWG